MVSESPRILVIRRRYLGDIVLLAPFFRNLRLHWPNADITLLAESAYVAAAALIPDVNHILHLPRSAREIAGWYALVRALRAGRFTHVFDLDNRQKTAVLTRLTGAPNRIGLLHAPPARLAGCYTRLVIDPPDEHEQHTISDYYLEALAGAKVPVATRQVRLVPRDTDIATISKSLVGTGPRLLVHPGSRSAFRIWPAGNFAAVCDLVQNELGGKIILVGGPAEQPVVDAIRSAARTELQTFAAPLSLPEFAALASLCDAMLCHDSGPMHVAAAVGTPVVALFGSQNATLWRPADERHTVLQPPLPCVNCIAPRECIPGDSYRNYCVRNLTVETVWTAVRARLTGATTAR